jgi:hypothetical protein
LRAARHPQKPQNNDPPAVAAFVDGEPSTNYKLIICTYQSSALVAPGRAALTVFDECHRTCGPAAPRPFNLHVYGAPGGARLFLTATPAYDGELSMNRRDLYGGVAYRYHMRRGIDAGYVNDFRLELVPAPGAAAKATPVDVLAAQVAAAAASAAKLLVFCRDIKHAEALRAAVEPLLAAGGPLLAATKSQQTTTAVAVHSRMPGREAAAALAAFAAPEGRAVLFNVRMFQEGVELPWLNGVFFAAPRRARRDIVQSLCRALNVMPGKPQSVVFLPLAAPARGADDADLGRYANIVPFVDALLDEDPRLYDHLLDPAGCPYPLGVLAASPSAAAKDLSAAAHLANLRRAVRYGAAGKTERLLRVERVPWDRAFAEIRRIVEVCGRYPKTTDAWAVRAVGNDADDDADAGGVVAQVPLHRFYRWGADAYRDAKEGRPSALEPHQLADLAALPGWEPYGVEGPYPWAECLAFLERWLADHHGVPPAVEINKGGYVGLDATPMERLSGTLTCINQQVFSKKVGEKFVTYNRVTAEHAADLDRVCAQYGLRWRKEFDADGAVDPGRPTFIQEAYQRFKAIYAAGGADDPYIVRWFPGYPGKHARQERPDVSAAGTAPARWRGAGKAPAARSKKSAAATPTARNPALPSAGGRIVGLPVVNL